MSKTDLQLANYDVMSKLNVFKVNCGNVKCPLKTENHE